MIIFLQPLGSCVAKAITKPFVVPKGDEDTWSDITVKKFEVKAKAHYALLQAFNDDISRVINCKSAYDIWNNLVVTHEGTTQVKRAKIDLLNSQYDNFYMLDGESIDDMLARFTSMTNELISLSKPIDNDKKCGRSLEHFSNLER